ncbi:MAG: excinuclease ABC subunit UvrC [Clostridia bacterium]|nr:excinuclease ABC subunit UvrC [Clostridia bacterium]
MDVPENIREALKQLPDSPGVYIHKDSLGNAIYVGKAVSLRSRVRQYFQSSRNMDPKVRSMVSQISEFEYITVDSEMEALILECNLIKKHRPKYNILLRDDKTYPYIKVTKEEWPRVIKTRQVRKDGGSYFGPYSDAGAVNRIVDLLNSSFALKRCSAVAFAPGFRPCLNYHINQCRGICTGGVSRDEYDEAVAGAVEFLRGHSAPLVNALKQRMKEASDRMDYETAAEYRDYIEAAQSLGETQRVVLHHASEADIVVRVEKTGAADDAVTDSFAVFSVRDGKLIGRETFSMDMSASIDSDRKSILEAFLNQHYSRMPEVPREIIVAQLPTNSGVLEQYLSEISAHSVRIIRPERGEKRALLKLALNDAAVLAESIDRKAKAAAERREALGSEIWDVLCQMGAEDGPYDGRQFRAEAYDISNTNGIDTVGAMVVYDGLKADKQGYRKFRVRTVEGQDDYASMREVLSRRFLRVFSGDDKFAILPDIIFMDGGKGHVTTALEVIEATGFDIPVVGMVKDDRHRTRGLIVRVKAGETADGDSEWREITLADKPLLYKYIGTMQEEVHRFAITYHHKLRSKNVEHSVLDDIEGIGPKRRKALLEAFGSVDEIRRVATGEDPVVALMGADGVDRRSAENVVKFFGSK